MITLMVITDGRRECIIRTIQSFNQMVDQTLISKKIMINDSGDQQYAEWLEQSYPEFEIFHSPGRSGFGGAIQRGFAQLGTSRYVLWLEDDFTLNEPIDLRDMVRVLQNNRHLAQLVLKRQPWNDAEKTAGGIIECWPQEFHEKTDGKNYWVEHTLFFSTNLNLTPRRTFVQGWPDGTGSERTFTDMLLKDPDTRFAFWGRKDDPPAIHHIGEQRAGIGY